MKQRRRLRQQTANKSPSSRHFNTEAQSPECGNHSYAGRGKREQRNTVIRVRPFAAYAYSGKRDDVFI